MDTQFEQPSINSSSFCWSCSADDLDANHSSSTCPYVCRPTEPELAVDNVVTNEINDVKEGNVIIETSADNIEKISYPSYFDDSSFTAASSTEQMFEFESLIGRWMLLDQFDVTTGSHVWGLIKTIEIPGSMVRNVLNSPNMLAFRNFLYSKMEVDLLFKVNATPFQQGRLIASTLHNPLHLWDASDDYYGACSAITRPHVFLELNGTHEVILPVNWNFHRSFVELSSNVMEHSFDRLGGVFVNVLIHTLTDLKNGANATSVKVPISVFFRFRRAKFGAITYATQPVMAEPQMGPLSTAANYVRSFKEVVGQVEDVLEYSAKVFNLDKPTDILNSIIVSPRPRLNFTHGKGISDAVPLRLDPSMTTTYYKDHVNMLEHRGIRSLVRMWGLHVKTNWKNSEDGASKDNIIWTEFVTPITLGEKKANVLYYPIPLHYFSNMYMFWRGTIEYRFDFICTDFHIGAVFIAVEFGRSNHVSWTDVGSEYSKVVELGKERSATIIVPYIYDTVWQRNHVIPFYGQDEPGNEKVARSGIYPTTNTRIVVKILNRLTAPETVPNNVDILVYKRAGKSFSLHSLVQCNHEPMNKRFVAPEGCIPFPFGFPPTTTNPRRKYDAVSNKKQSMSFAALYYSLSLEEGLKKAKTDIIGSDNQFKKFKLSEYAAKKDDLKKPVAQSDFNHGESFKNIQSKEKFMSLKDIFRRPIMIVSKYAINNNIPNSDGTVSLFYLPLMPPTSSIVSTNSFSLLPRMVHRSPHCNILNCFRYWRGEMRYTLVFHKFNSGTIIYIHTIPRSGVRIFGNFTDCTESGDAQGKMLPIFDLGFTGLPTEIVIPLINPSVQVEVPFMTESNFCLLNNGPSPAGLNTNFSWYDGSDDNVGHLIISSSTDVAVDIFWAGGDSFEVANFIGMPTMQKTLCKTTISDDHPCINFTTKFTPENKIYDAGIPVPQGDDWPVPSFIGKSSLTKKQVVNSIKNAAIVGAATYIGGPTVGTGAATLIGLNNVGSLVSKCEKNVDEVANVIQQTAKHVESGTKLLPELLSNVNKDSILTGSILTMIEQTLAGIIGPNDKSEFYEKCSIILLEFYSAWQTPNLKSICASIVRILLTMRIISASWIERVLKGLFGLLSRYCPSVQSEEEGTSFQFSDNDIANMCSLALGATSAILGVTFRSTSFAGQCMDLFKSFTSSSTWSVISNGSRFFKDVLSLFKRAYSYVLGIEDSEAKILQCLSEKSIFLKSFIKEAQEFLAEANLPALNRLPHMKLKFWILVSNAYQLQALIAAHPNQRVSVALQTIIKDLIKKSNESFIQLSNSQVRYEPFVVCISGPSQVGKSHMTHRIARELLNEINFTSMEETVYTKSPGPEYWNGLRQQPVVNFDDFLNLLSVQSRESQLQELYNLKSTATFNPNMARIEEKELRANPLIIILCCNIPFPDLSATLSDERAFRRRRDVLLHVELDKEVMEINKAKYVRDLPFEVLKDYGHLKFGLYQDPCRDELYSNKVSFQSMIQWLRKEFHRYHLFEQRNIAMRIQDINATLPKNAMKCMNVGDPFTVLFKTISGVDKKYVGEEILPTAQLNLAAEIMAKEIERNMKVNVPTDKEINEQRIENPFENGEKPSFQAFEGPNPFGEGTSKQIIQSLQKPSLEVEDLPPPNQCVQGSPNWWYAYVRADDRMLLRRSLMEGILNAEFNEDRLRLYLQLKFNALRNNVGRCMSCRNIHLIAYVCPAERSRVLEDAVQEEKQLCKACAFMMMDKHMVVKCSCGCGESMIQSSVAKFDNLYFIQYLKYYIKDVAIESLCGLVRIFEASVIAMSYVSPTFAEYAIHMSNGCLDYFSRSLLGAGMTVLSSYRPSCEKSVGYSLLTPFQTFTELQSKLYDFIECPKVQKGFDSNLQRELNVKAFEENRKKMIEKFIEVGIIPKDSFLIKDFEQDKNNRVTVEEFFSSDESEEDSIKEKPAFTVTLDSAKSIRKVDKCLHHLIEPDMGYTNTKEAPDSFIHFNHRTFEIQYIPNSICSAECVWTHSIRKKFLEQWVNENWVIYSNALSMRKKKDIRSFIPEETLPRDAVYKFDKEWMDGVMKSLDEHAAVPWYYFWKNEKFQWILPTLKFISYALMGIVAIKTCYRGFKYLFGEPHVQMGAGGYPNEMRTPRINTRSIRVRTSRPVSQSMTTTNAAIEGITRNMGQLVITDETGRDLAACNFVGICGKYAIFLKHYVSKIKKYITEYEGLTGRVQDQTKNGPSVNVDLYTLEFIDTPITDISFFKLPPAYPLFKDIRKFFPTKEYMDTHEIYSDGVLVEGASLTERIIQIRSINFQKYCEEVQVMDLENNDYNLTGVMQYNYSKKGACGSLALVENYESPIIGVHVAGYGVEHRGIGYAVIIAREDFQFCEAQMVVDIEECKLAEDVEKARIHLPGDCNLLVLGRAKTGVHIASKSQIVPSEISGSLPSPLTQPVILHSLDSRYINRPSSPLLDGILKHGQIPGGLNSFHVRVTTEFMKQFYGKFRSKRIKIKPLTYKEAIIGIKELPGYEPIPMDTSSGWPWMTYNFVKDKTPWIEIIRDSNLEPIDCKLNIELLRELDRKRILRIQGILPTTVFADFLKDERKENEKIQKIGATRVFCASPLDFTIASRQYMLDFYVTLQEQRFESGVAIGIAVDGPEWGCLVRYLSEVGNNIFSFDYKNFGPTCSAQAVEAVKETVVEWYRKQGWNEEDLRIISVLHEELNCSKHIALDLVYQQFCGSPSGSPLTAPQNSLVNVFFLAYSWLGITGKPFSEFEKNVRFVTYGDDSLVSVSDEYRGDYNALTVIAYLNSNGVRVTAADKTDNIVAYQTIDEVTFLKRHFVKHPFRQLQYLAPLPRPSIEDTAKWINKKNDPKEATIQNAEQSLRMAYSRGKKYFDDWKEILNGALEKHGFLPLRLTWEEIDENFFGETPYVFSTKLGEIFQPFRDLRPIKKFM